VTGAAGSVSAASQPESRLQDITTSNTLCTLGLVTTSDVQQHNFVTNTALYVSHNVNPCGFTTADIDNITTADIDNI